MKFRGLVYLFWFSIIVLVLPGVAYIVSRVCADNTTFRVGAGVYDITGPAAEQGMMGYAILEQKTAGIYQRIWARAFVIESPCNGKRIVFVNADLGQLFQGVKQEVVRKLQAKYGDRYNHKNVLLTANHQHSGPGGYSTYALYNFTTLGFNRKNFNAIVDGIVKAVERAQNNMQNTQVKLASGTLTGIGINRSAQAYLQNPADERQSYSHNIDTTMTLLSFGSRIGLINWYPLHGTSMNNQNRLINGDNKGYAEYLFERDFKSDYGPRAFVAAFAQANVGDVSPNLGGKGGGKGLAGIRAVEKAGGPQYGMAKKLFNAAQKVMKGGVDYRHTFVKMDEVSIDPKFTDGKPQKTCSAAIGVSMLAGTTDGEGFGKQGVTCAGVSELFPTIACSITTNPCQGVKPIALATGKMKPYPWTPNFLPLQLFKVGNLAIIAVPFEMTTMAGRRLQKAVLGELESVGVTDAVISGLSNAYVGYVVTPEEYQLQLYEGASTHFGPWTLAALLQEFTKLAQAMARGKSVPDDPKPPYLVDKQIGLQTGVVFDDKPLLKKFGSVHKDVQSTYKPGSTVNAVFWGAHPKNNYRTQDTFLAVQRMEGGKWITVRQDRDWDTEYHWKRDGIANSLVTIVWRIPTDVTPGEYRIVHYGDWKSGLTKKIAPYAGYSSSFTVQR